MLADVQKHESSPSSRPFWPAAVTSSKSLSVTVERSYLLLSQAEFARMFGFRPKAKMPRVPRVELTGLDGKTEVAWVFLPDDESHRRLVIKSTEGENATSELMTAAQHLHETQAGMMSSMKTQQRMSSSLVGKLLEPGGSSSLCTISEYKAGFLLTQLTQNPGGAKKKCVCSWGCWRLLFCEGPQPAGETER